MQQVLPFESVFMVNSTDNSITTRVPVRVAGVTIGINETLRQGYVVGGIDLTQFVNRQLQVEIENGIYIIRGII